MPWINKALEVIVPCSPSRDAKTKGILTQNIEDVLRNKE